MAALGRSSSRPPIDAPAATVRVARREAQRSRSPRPISAPNRAEPVEGETVWTDRRKS